MADDMTKDQLHDHLEHVVSDTGDEKQNYSRIDAEVAQYTSTTKIVVDEATNKRLKRQIDKRVLSIMIFTYFLQALDKGLLAL